MGKNRERVSWRRLESIEACIANERRASNGSPDFQADGLKYRSFDMQTSIEGATGFAVVTMHAVFAEIEARRISERTTEALRYRRQRGMPANGHSPYGMRRRKRRRPDGGQGSYDEWDAGECADIREIYRRVHDNDE